MLVTGSWVQDRSGYGGRTWRTMKRRLYLRDWKRRHLISLVAHRG